MVNSYSEPIYKQIVGLLPIPSSSFSRRLPMPKGNPIKNQQLQTVPVSESNQDYYFWRLKLTISTTAYC